VGLYSHHSSSTLRLCVSIDLREKKRKDSKKKKNCVIINSLLQIRSLTPREIQRKRGEGKKKKDRKREGKKRRKKGESPEDTETPGTSSPPILAHMKGKKIREEKLHLHTFPNPLFKPSEGEVSRKRKKGEEYNRINKPSNNSPPSVKKTRRSIEKSILGRRRRFSLFDLILTGFQKKERKGGDSSAVPLIFFYLFFFHGVSEKGEKEDGEGKGGGKRGKRFGVFLILKGTFAAVNSKKPA